IIVSFLFLYRLRRAPTSTLFPYTTLFRSSTYAAESFQRRADGFGGDCNYSGGRGVVGDRLWGRRRFLFHVDPHDAHVDDTVDAKDRKSTRLNSSHVAISYAVFCLKKKTET